MEDDSSARSRHCENVDAFGFCQARFARDELHHAFAAVALPCAERHGLDHQSKARIRRCAFGLPQQARGCAIPGTCHRAQNVPQLFDRFLWEIFIGFGQISRFHRIDCGRISQIAALKWIRIQPLDFYGEGTDELAIQRIGGLRPDAG